MTDSHRPPLTAWKLRGTIVTGIVVFLTVFVLLQSPPAVEPPQVELAGVEPAVAAGLVDARQAVINDPVSVESWAQLGMTFHAHEYVSEALDCYREAARLDPRDARWPYLSGTLLYASDRTAARRSFQRAVDLDSDSALNHVRLAEVCLDMADLELAKVHLQAALAIEPENPRTQFRLAQYHLLMNEPLLALPLAESALSAIPHHRAVLQLLVTIEGRLGDSDSVSTRRYQEQLHTDSKLVSGWPDPLGSQVQLFRLDTWRLVAQGQSRLDHGDVSGSVALLRKAIQQVPGNPSFRARLATAYLRSGQLNKARQVISEAPPEQREQFDLVRVSAAVSLLAEDWDGAAVSLEAVLKQKPDSSELLTDLGFVRRQQGRFADAVSTFEQSISLDPKTPATWKQLVETLAESSDRTAAREALARALSYLPDHPELQTLHTVVAD